MIRSGVWGAAGAAIIVAMLLIGPGDASAQTVSPSQFYAATLANGNLNQEAGEDWAWHANFNMGHFMTAYKAWGDEDWLDYGTQYYDYAIGRGGLYLFRWDGTDVDGDPLTAGDYRIRWTLTDSTFGDEGFREYSIEIVPEPGTLTLLGLGGLALAARRRR